MASRIETIVRNRNGRLIAPHFAVLSYIRGTEGVNREVRAYGTPISDRTVHLAVKAGLIEEGVSDTTETRDETFLILSPKGRETYLALNGYL